MNVRMIFIHALSPIHCGVGRGLGGIDLPIARERPTNIPLVPGSTVKGTLRARAPQGDRTATVVFGPDTDRASEHAGSVQFSDANLVFLPTRSVWGTFAWVTSPYLQRRLRRDAAEAGLDALTSLPVVRPASVDDAYVAPGATLVGGGRIVLEDFDFKAHEEAGVGELAREIARHAFGDASDEAFFAARLCVVHDDVMAVLLRTGTEVVARNRLDPETKTVARGALWTEEALPVESILAGVVVATPVGGKQATGPVELLDYVAGLTAGVIQVGGKASVGRGLCRVRVSG